MGLVPLIYLLLAMADGPARVEVVADRLDLMDGPRASAFAAGRVRRGDVLEVVEDDGGGWVGVAPPAGSFSWVDRADLGPMRGGRARVVAEEAEVRAGSPSAQMPGRPRRLLGQGDEVRAVDRPPLDLGGRTLVAVRPPAGEVRYVRAGGVRAVAEEADPFAARGASGPPTIRPVKADPIDVDPGLFAPPSAAGPFTQVESDHRAAVSGPIEGWRLEEVRKAYEALAGDPSTATEARRRLAEVDRQAAIAEAARGFRQADDRARGVDSKVAAARRRLEGSARRGPGRFDAEGLVQASNRQVGGEPVYALIGPDGSTTAYLSLPAGVSGRAVVGRKVAVRGEVGYDEGLRAKLITVQEWEPRGVAP